MENLYKIRKQKQMSQLALAVKVGVSQETISSYETGKAFPSADILLKLCEEFDVSSDYLLDKTDVKMTLKDFCQNELSADELELLHNFRKLSHLKRSKALGVIIGMAEE